MRNCGVLMHITSLPSPYGIGTMGRQAKEFIKWLVSAGQHYWQVLPIGPTGYGDSPYQSFSTFAGNPLLIDLEELIYRGMISRADCEGMDFGSDPEKVDYGRIVSSKMALLKKAYERFDTRIKKYREFERKESFWLDDYSLFMAIKEENNNVSWVEWRDDVRLRNKDALDAARVRLKKETGFWKFVQFFFYEQWTRLKSFANENGIEIIGDLPIYVSPDSSDVWSAPELYLMNEERRPSFVAGVPPDYFSATGQLWGNPIYDWEAMKKQGYKWWIKRIEKAVTLFDKVRIDHFRAFDTYWAIPAGDDTAVNGTWEKGPGMELFDAVKEALGDAPIIAEDLGDIFDSVKELLRDTGFPGMRVLQFGFNPDYTDNDHLPHNYVNNLVCYTGTHDNSTVQGWYKAADEKSREMCLRYLKPMLFEKINRTMIRELYKSSADLAIVPMQDIIGLDDSARMNIPSTLGGNWCWRALKKHFSLKNAAYMKNLAKDYFRYTDKTK